MMAMDSLIARLRDKCNSVRSQFHSKTSLYTDFLTGVIVPELQQVLSRWEAEIVSDRHSVGSRPWLSHYTSLHNLVSLVEGADRSSSVASTLRLFPTYRFNDRNEGRHLAQSIAEMTDYDWLNTDVRTLAFAACFVGGDDNRAGDDLVYWRSYGHDGEGCSLTWKPTTAPPHLYAVQYESSDAVRALERVIKALEPLVYVRNPRANRLARTILGTTVWQALSRVRYLYKNPHYSYERESRVLIAETDDAFDREKVCVVDAGRSSNPPQVQRYYVDDSLSVKAIFGSGSVITLGPRTLNVDDTRAYIESLLEDRGLTAEIRISSAPYRAS